MTINGITVTVPSSAPLAAASSKEPLKKKPSAPSICTKKPSAKQDIEQEEEDDDEDEDEDEVEEQQEDGEEGEDDDDDDGDSDENDEVEEHGDSEDEEEADEDDETKEGELGRKDTKAHGIAKKPAALLIKYAKAVQLNTHRDTFYVQRDGHALKLQHTKAAHS